MSNQNQDLEEQSVKNWSRHSPCGSTNPEHSCKKQIVQSGWAARIIFINNGSRGVGRILKPILSVLLGKTLGRHTEARLRISFYNELHFSILNSSLITRGRATMITDIAFLVFIRTSSSQAWHLAGGLRCLSLEISQWPSERRTAIC